MAFALPSVDCATSSSWAGLWQRKTASARWATSAFDSTASPPSSAASASALPGTASATSAGSPKPRASALAMLPAPISPICMAPKDRDGPPVRRLRLVEEALLDEAGPLLHRHLDVARGEQEHLVGDPLHAAVHGIREPGGEVDKPLREVRVRALKVQDHRDRVLELVGDLLGVVEVLGDHEVDLHPARAAAAVVNGA